MMPITFEQSKDEIARRVEHYFTNRAHYRSGAFKEAHARQEFIDPLFIALGWDVHNAARLAPDYREVVIEDALEIEGVFSDPADKTCHDKMVGLVEKMLDLHRRKAEAGSEAERERLQRLIDDTDAQIDALVYELYGLTEEEVRVVEGKS